MPPHERLPEVELQLLLTVMKAAFQILPGEPIIGKPYFVRLIGPPYRPKDPNCRNLIVPTDNRGTTVCPLVIRQVLNKFQIKGADFVQALNDSKLETMAVPVKKRPTGSEG